MTGIERSRLAASSDMMAAAPTLRGFKTLGGFNQLFLLLFACWAFSSSCTSEAPPENIPVEMAYIPGGTYHKPAQAGNEVQEIEIKGFLLDKHPVTVAEFQAFVKATSYITDAEKLGDAGVFDLKKKEWTLVKGAYWEYPFGKDKSPAAADHPVTQVSWRDAQAYCLWAGKRLPTEYEWEWAARKAGKTSSRYSWGDSLLQAGKYQANVWQGNFPEENTAEDGYLYTAPTGLFGKTGNGLSDMGGNVWQWVTQDEGEDSFSDDGVEKRMKGGSFMCDSSFCHNYRIDGGTSSSAETALFHTGFRCARSL